MVGVIFIICMAVGYLRGFFRIALSLLSVVLTIVLMIVLNLSLIHIYIFRLKI